MYVAEYPLITDEGGLPFLICGIGKTSHQPKVVREDGYCIHQLLYTKSGIGMLIYGGKKYDMTPGNIVCLSTDIPYEYYPISDQWAINWITYTGDNLAFNLTKLGLEKLQVVHFDKLEPIDNLFNKILVLLKSKHKHCVYTSASLLYGLLIEIFKQKKQLREKSGVAEDKYINAVTNYIDNNYRKNITLRDMSEQAEITPEHLCKVFKKYMNLRPFEYLTKKRIQEAKRLLVQTSTPIAKIGKMVGYEDKSYFGYVFKKYEKVTPSEFRGIISFIE
jgi:AraC-like DNA-binding protein